MAPQMDQFNNTGGPSNHMNMQPHQQNQGQPSQHPINMNVSGGGSNMGGAPMSMD